MKPLESKERGGRQVKSDGQLMLGFGHPQPRQVLPEANRGKCIALFGRMLLAAIKSQPGTSSHER